jgi:ureidoglycolate lyase
MQDPHAVSPHQLCLEPLSAEAFAPFGEVVAIAADTPHRSINAGYAQRFDGLAHIDTTEAGGQTILSIFRTQPRQLPFKLSVMESHQLGSQLFMPLGGQSFVVVVAKAGPPPQPEGLRAFWVPPGQGVNLARGTWHHPLLALDAAGDFLVIERGGLGVAEDCEENDLTLANVWVGPGTR